MDVVGLADVHRPRTDARSSGAANTGRKGGTRAASGRATFKLGWARLNQSRGPEAARAFAQAIALARRSGAAAILREAASDLAGTLARSRANTSAALLEGLVSASADDPALLRSMLDRAMNELRDSDRGADAVQLWDLAARRDPRWGCEREAHAIEAASSNAALVARVTALRAQLTCE